MDAISVVYSVDMGNYSSWMRMGLNQQTSNAPGERRNGATAGWRDSLGGEGVAKRADPGSTLR
jgi:hypothetical protein